MAWSSAELSATELADLAADKPLLGVPARAVTAQWEDQGTGAAATDDTDASYPALRATDGFAHLDTRSDGDAASTWYLDISFPSMSPASFDAIAIMGANWASYTPTSVTVEIDDDLNFGTPTAIADFGTPTTNDRLIDLELYHTGSVARRYSDVLYARLKIVNNTNFTPQVGEVMFLRRRQLRHNPVAPYSKDSRASGFAIHSALSGINTRIDYHRGRMLWEATLRTPTDTTADDIVDFYDSCWGPFVWIWQPTSAPNAYNLMLLDQDRFDQPNIDWIDRSATLRASEQGPERFYLANE